MIVFKSKYSQVRFSIIILHIKGSFYIIWCFTVITGQLPTKEKDDVEDRNQEDSIAVTKIVKKDTVKNSSESLKTEDEAKSVISHQEIQKKFDGGKCNKVAPIPNIEMS